MELVINDKKFNIEFNELTEETQIRLYSEDQECFREYALKSKYRTVRNLVVSNENADFSILKAMGENLDIIEEIWNNPNFTKPEGITRKMIKGEMRITIAKDEKIPSEILNAILVGEVTGKYKDCYQSAYAISHNPNFKMTDETRIILLLKPSHSVHFDLAVNDEGTTSELLNEVFRKLLIGRKAGYRRAVNSILFSKNFKMDSESKKVWMDSTYRRDEIPATKRSIKRWKKEKTEIKKQLDNEDLDKYTREWQENKLSKVEKEIEKKQNELEFLESL